MDIIEMGELAERMAGSLNRFVSKLFKDFDKGMKDKPKKIDPPKNWVKRREKKNKRST